RHRRRLAGRARARRAAPQSCGVLPRARDRGSTRRRAPLPPSDPMSRRALVLLLNDRLVPARRATISALDRGFVYGDGLFETVPTYAGTPFGLPQHIRRLARSARVFRIPFEASPDYWMPRVRRCLRANDLLATDAAVRLTVSRVPRRFGIVPPADLRPTTMMLATPVGPRVSEAQARGVSICFFPFRLVT